MKAKAYTFDSPTDRNPVTQSIDQQHAAFFEDANEWLSQEPAFPLTISALLVDLSIFDADDEKQIAAVSKFLTENDCEGLPAPLKRSIRRWEHWPDLERLLASTARKLAG